MLFRRRNKLLSDKPHEVMGELLGMKVYPGETTDDIASRIADEPMRWRAELKARGYYTPALELLEDVFDASDGPEKDDRGREWLEALAEAHRQMPRRRLWRRILGA